MHQAGVRVAVGNSELERTLPKPRMTLAAVESGRVPCPRFILPRSPPMIGPSQPTASNPQATAIIRLTIPRREIQKAMGPGIADQRLAG